MASGREARKMLHSQGIDPRQRADVAGIEDDLISQLVHLRLELRMADQDDDKVDIPQECVKIVILVGGQGSRLTIGS